MRAHSQTVRTGIRSGSKRLCVQSAELQPCKNRPFPQNLHL